MSIVRVAVVLTAMVTLSVEVSPARASPSSSAAAKTRVRVRYRAPEGCRTAGDFEADLLRRTPRLEVVDDESEGVLVFDARIEATPSGTAYVGTLSGVGEKAGEPHRLRAATCADVASAIAFTLALSVDPDARADTPGDARSPAPPASPPPPPTSPPLSTVSAPALRPDPDSARLATPSGARKERTLAVGVGGLVVAGLFTDPLVGVVASVESRGVASDPRAYIVRARLLAGAMASRPADREAAVSIAAIGVDVCPTGLSLGPFVLRPCVGATPGIARGAAARVDQPDDANAFLLTVAVRAIVEVPLGGAFALILDGAADATLVRPRFYVDPPLHTVAEANRFAGEGSLALSVRFP